MFKKAMPLVLVSGLVLTACANNGAVPKNNETPMETRDYTPRVNDGQTGPNMDGIDNGRDMNRNGNGNGIMNDNNGVINGTDRNGVINDGNTTTPREDIIIDERTPNEVIIEEDRNRKRLDPVFAYWGFNGLEGQSWKKGLKFPLFSGF
jgi:hypothetical protein